jgi:transposase
VNKTPTETIPVWARNLLKKLHGELSIDVELLDLPGWRTICAVKSPHDLIIVAESLSELSACPACGGPATALQRYGLMRPQYVFDVPARGQRVRLYFRLQRYLCTAGKCRKTSVQPLSGLDARRRATERLVRYIEREAFKVNKTFIMVADEVGVSDQLVRNISTDCAERLEKARRIETPLWLAIDEVYIKKKERCVLTSPAERRFVDILFGNDQQTVLKALLQLPDRRSIKVVTMGIYAPYYGVLRRVLPQAAIVIDRYHVQERPTAC